jgi:hypothetical protein
MTRINVEEWALKYNAKAFSGQKWDFEKKRFLTHDKAPVGDGSPEMRRH